MRLISMDDDKQKFTFKQLQEKFPDISLDDIKKKLKNNRVYLHYLDLEQNWGYSVPFITIAKFKELMETVDKTKTRKFKHVLEFTVDPKSAVVFYDVNENSPNKKFEFEQLNDLYVLKSEEPIIYDIYLEDEGNTVKRTVKVDSSFKRLSFMVDPVSFLRYFIM